MKIRQATLSDRNSLLPQIIIFEEQHVAYEDGTMTAQARTRIVEDLTRHIRKRKYWVVEVDNQVVGFIKAEILDTNLDTLLIDYLFVSSKFRHQGIGTKLIKFAEDYFKPKGAIKSRLWVAKQNTNAEKLYKYLGFKYHPNIWKQYIKKIK